MSRNLSPPVTIVIQPTEINQPCASLPAFDYLSLSLFLLFKAPGHFNPWRCPHYAPKCCVVSGDDTSLYPPSRQQQSATYMKTPTEGISNQQSVSIWQRKHLLSNRCHTLQPQDWTFPCWAWWRIKKWCGLNFTNEHDFLYRLNEITEMRFWSLYVY